MLAQTCKKAGRLPTSAGERLDRGGGGGGCCVLVGWGDQAVLHLFLILLSGLWLAQAWVHHGHHRGISEQAQCGSPAKPLVARVHKQHVGA